MSVNYGVDFVFLDSGTGGIPYLAKLRELFPSSSCVYVGDTSNFPYGEKPLEQVISCAVSIAGQIIKKFNPRAIVVACNTISVNALSVLRKTYPDTLFVGTVPAIKLAGKISKKRCIGLLATNSTIKSPLNRELKEQFASDCRLILRGDPKLISFIEHKSFTAQKKDIESAVKPAIDFFKNEGCDVIVLGCTHFLNISDIIQKVCGDEIAVVDSREGVARRALSVVNDDRGVVGTPTREGGEQRSASQGEASPSLYITGFSEKKDREEYDVICSKYGMIFRGLLE